MDHLQKMHIKFVRGEGLSKRDYGISDSSTIIEQATGFGEEITLTLVNFSF